MGRVVGRFYAADGNRTAELERVEAAAAEYGSQQPPDRPLGSACNVQWSASAGENARLKPVHTQQTAHPFSCATMMCDPPVYGRHSVAVQYALDQPVARRARWCSHLGSQPNTLGLGVPAAPRRAVCNPAGKEVWCSEGKGFPRRVAAPTGDAAAAVERCECSEQPVFSDAAQLYDGCPQTATRCRVGGAAA